MMVLCRSHVLQGDYNFDNSVDAGDYVIWRKNSSTNGNGGRRMKLATRSGGITSVRASQVRAPGQR